MKNRLLSILLVAVLLIGLLPAWAAPVYGEEVQEYDITYPIEGGELHFDSKTGTIVSASCGESVTIPSEINGVAVVAIGPGAFEQSQMREIVISDSVTTIGALAFQSCRALKRVVLPEGLTEIQHGTFNLCQNLVEINLPASLKTIGEYAFHQCSALPQLQLPEGLTSIGASAFAYCAWREAVIPDSVTDIGGAVFFCCDWLEKVRLPAGMKTIPENMFYQCTKLTQVNIPESVTHIEDGAFNQCGALENITLPPHLESIGAYAFYLCASMKQISIPATVTRIEEWAFASCPIENVDLPDSLEYLGYCAFAGCLNIQVSNGIRYLDGWMISVDQFGDGNATVREGTIGIAEQAISYTNEQRPWERLLSVSIPASVRYLDISAFGVVNKLKRVTVAKENPYFSVKSGMLCNQDGTKLIFCPGDTGVDYLVLPEGFKEIGPSAFSHNETLRRITLPDSLEAIGDNAFFKSNIICVKFGKGLKTIGDGAFKSCKLTCITLGEKVESIGAEAFLECGLAQISFGNSLESIGKQAFAGNELLKSVEFPAAVKTIGEAAFFGCESLTTAVFKGNAPEIAQAAFWHGRYEVYWAENMPWYEPLAVTLYYAEGSGWDAVTEYPVEQWKGSEQPAFSDAPRNAWYAESVDYAVRNGLMNGVGNGKFDPEGSMTRAMLVTVLWRFVGAPTYSTSSFTDVRGNEWYTEAIAWAEQSNIVGGVAPGRFDPEGKITREQMVAILYRFSEHYAFDTTEQCELSGFVDGQRVAFYAKDAMQWAVATGIVGGIKEANGMHLDPQGNATRAQVATILMRFFEGQVK